MSAPHVFVMQKFDGGKVYDKRYEEIFKPALEEANTIPVRADSILGLQPIIEKIEQAIKNADICFADISTDNPNVWLEVGYALALSKPLVMVCDTQREKMPFDVSHRPIIMFKADVPSDFDHLKRRINEEIKNELDRQTRLGSVQAVPASSIKIGDLSTYEVGILASVCAMYGSMNDGLRHAEIIERMSKMGFTDSITGIGLMKLTKKNFIVREVISDMDSFGNEYREEYFKITEQGKEWLVENDKYIEIAKYAPESKDLMKRYSGSDDEIPF